MTNYFSGKPRLSYRTKSVLAVILGLVLVFGMIVRDRNAEPLTQTGFALDTSVTVTLYDHQKQDILDHCFSMIRAYENEFSKTIEGSEVYKLNHRENGTGTFSISDDLADVLSEALHFSEISDGAYDVTIEPASTLWNFSGNPGKVPDKADIAAAAAKIDYRNLKLEGDQLTFLSPDTTIDLGSIAKGYIADRLKAYLESTGVRSAIINLGGNVLCVGENGRKPFVVGIQKPFADHSTVYATLNIDGQSVVSSGVYERHFVVDGVNYHHILDPKTGWPVENGLVQVTIVSDRSVDGDALSTTCFALGTEKGKALIESMDGVYGFFMDDQYQVTYTKGADALIKEIHEQEK